MDTKQIIDRVCKPGQVEWTYAGLHRTRSGKEKEVIQGIPQAGFWSFWRQCKRDPMLKLALKAAGITLFNHGKTATGETRTHKGVSKPVYKSSWEVTIWVNKGNRNALAGMGFELAGIAAETPPPEIEAWERVDSAEMVDNPF